MCPWKGFSILMVIPALYGIGRHDWEWFAWFALLAIVSAIFSLKEKV